MMENDACIGLISSSNSVDPGNIILFILALIVLVVLLGCVWAFFYAIFLFIFSKGDDKKVQSARNSIRYMIIGLFLTVMLLFIGPSLFKLFKMDNAESYGAMQIFGKIGAIVTCASQGVTAVVTDYPNNNPFGSEGSTVLERFSGDDSTDDTSSDDSYVIYKL